MPENLQLIVHNTGYIISALMVICYITFIFIKDRHSLANKMLIASFISVLFFLLSHLIAVNISDPRLSRIILTFNLSSIFIGVFLTHASLIFLGKAEEQRRTINFIYVVSVALALFFSFFPDTFLLDSVPKMYFPNYYNGGSLYWLHIAWNVSVASYFLFQLFRSYFTANEHLKNRLKYFFTAFFFGYVFGTTAYPLVLNVHVDPIWSIFMVPSFTILFTYAILKYDLLDIRVVFKRAFVYSVLVGSVGIFIILFNIINNYITSSYPGFPLWLLPLLSSGTAVAIGFYVWNKFREGELLKYEFITVVTHKFRTPLTHIKWASENIASRPRKEEDKAQISYIQSANLKLIELTNLLMTVSETEGGAYGYKVEPNNLSETASEVIQSLSTPIASRAIQLATILDPDLQSEFDSNRIKFVLQTFIENAINYSPMGGAVTIVTRRENGMNICSVTDTGIGINKTELSLLFSKFYRGKQAKLTDTEGMGIGLYISKEIISRHNGKIWVESDGEGKGSTFSFSLPAIQ
jgi:signal transduction histidine kinase